MNNIEKSRQSVQGLRKISHQIFRWAPLLLLLILAVVAFFFPAIEGDTEALVRGAGKIKDCILLGRWNGCSGSEHFALFQYLPTLLLKGMGLTDRWVLRCLTVLSFFSFLGTLRVFYQGLKCRSTNGALLGIMIMSSGPLLWYSRSSFGEMLAAFLILFYLEACVSRRSPLRVALCLVGAGLTKEPALPFLLLLGGAGILLGGLRSGPIRRRNGVWSYCPAVALGSITTVALTLGFDYFRFGVFYNLTILDPLFRVPSFATQLSFFLGIWFSPNGGMFFFWPTFFLPFVLLVLGSRVRKPSWNAMTLGPLAVIIVTLILLTFGFSAWFAPLGWVAWGPRLLLPWIPASLYLLLYSYSLEIDAALREIQSRTKFLPTLLVGAFIMVSIPSFVILHWKQVLWRIFGPTPECPTPAVIQENAPYYYQCMHALLWPKNIALFDLYFVLIRPELLFMTAIYCLALARIWREIWLDHSANSILGQKEGIGQVEVQKRYE